MRRRTNTILMVLLGRVMAGLLACALIFTPIAQAADIQAQLDSNNGSSGLSIQSSTPSEVARVDSNGNLTTHGNAGIGTTTANYTLDVMGDIGDSNSQMLILQDQGGSVRTSNNILDDGFGNGYFAGFVGIGSTAPGEQLDVTGTVRTINFTMSGSTPISGYVLTASDSSGDATWTAAGTVGGWTVSGTSVYQTYGGNVGIGTSAPGAALAVGLNAFTVNSSGEITATTGIISSGPYTQSGPEFNTFSGNVGISSSAPGQALDVNGTVRMTGLTMSGSNPFVGYVLTASDSSGDATWTSAGLVGGWSVSGNNVFETLNGNVGIGTSSVTQGALVVTNGNVGIGTWVASEPLTVGTNAFTVGSNGLITTATGIVTSGPYTQSGNGINAFSGNVGISSTAPGQALDVTGTTRTVNFTMSGSNPFVGYVLTASDSSGDATWTSAGLVGGWTVSGNDVYETLGGNVGIGTSFTTAGAALSVMNGNVGIGTWAPTEALEVNGVGAFGAANIFGDATGNLYVGEAANALGGEATAFGTAAFANGSQSVALGYSSSTGNPNSIAIGALATANGSSSTALGFSATAAGNNSEAIGTNAAAPNQYSTSIGYGVGSTSDYQLSLGGYNPTSTASENWLTIVPTTTANAPIVSIGGPGTNVGIGTITPKGSLIVATGNVGIGSLAPGQALDVTGTIRTVNFTMSGANPFVGYVLTASDSSGDATWTSAGLVGGWTVSGNNVFETLNGNVGIGTSSVTQGALLVTNGNVGIGTWAPTEALTVGANAFTVDNNGQITTTSGIITSGPYTQSGNGINAFSGNVGISSTAPGQALDVTGTTRTVNFTMSGANPFVGYVLTASDSSGDATWTSAGLVGGWTVSGNDVYETLSGNVGIGTTTITQGALVVTNGNVGIGTWAPTSPLAVGANAFTVSSGGAITATTGITTSGSYTQSGGSPNTLSGTTTFSASGTSATFTGNVGIGTSNPFGGNLIINGGGNVGLNSLTPGQALDVNGTIRTTGFAFTGGNPFLGYVLTSSDNSGDATWASVAAISGWTVAGNDVYETNNGNVGIGTSTVTQGSLVVTNGNVGIGTWAPTEALTVGANAFTVGSNGLITTATGIVTSGPYTQSGSGINAFSGNVGIGSLAPGQALDVNGTVRTVNLTVSGTNPFIGYVLTASDSSGDATWTSPGTVSGWTIAGNYLYTTTLGNTVGIGTINPLSKLNVNGGVGIGTSLTSGAYLNANLAPSGGLIVQNNVGIGTFNPFGGGLIVLPANTGNVGIGSLAPGQALDVTGNIRGTGEIINGNVGIGTSALQTAFAVANGNVGIGTWTAAGGNLIVNGGGNVGIGTAWPGQALDVNGTVRTTGFDFTGGNPFLGYVLTASDSSGDATWTSAGLVGGWTVSGNDVYETLSGNVGIGTTTVNQGSLVVTNGNVGIGTWVATAPLTVGTNAFTVGSNGLITTATGIVTSGPYTQSGSGINAFSGNVGIGSLAPGQTLDVNGTVRTIGLTMSGSSPFIGYVLTASDSSGDATWTSPGTVSGWTIAGNYLYTTTLGNTVGIGTINPLSKLNVNGGVGIGTSLTSGAYLNANLAPSGGLIVQNNVGIGTFNPFGGGLIVLPANTGNVGIGSLAPGQALDVTGNIRGTGEIINGNVGIGTSALQTAFAVANGNVGIGTWTAAGGNLIVNGGGNVGIGTAWPGQSLDVTGNIRGTGAIINGNVGIGTSALQTAFAVANGNVGIGTWTAAGGNLIVNGGGNVGIGTAWPGQALDVNGTVRTIGLTMSGSSPFIGYVLTASDSSGDATWTSPGTVSGWTIAGNYLYTTTLGNTVGIGTINPLSKLNVNGGVGIGTSLTSGAYLNANLAPSGGLIVQNNVGIGTFNPFGGGLIVLPANTGNVGIGSLAPGQALDVTGNIRGTGEIINGNVGIGTSALQTAFAVANGNVGIGTWTAAGGNLIVNGGGNVGIGTAWPGQALDVNGTVRTTGFDFTGGNPFLGYVLTSSDNSGDATWESVAAISGWTTSGPNVYETGSGNVGIGTTTVNQGSLVVTNGNVGIGTWVATAPLTVGTNAFTVGSNGLITTATGIVTSGPYTQSGSGINAFSGNVGIGSLAPGQTLDVNGTVRTIGLTMSGSSPFIGYVLTASDSSGDATWTSPGTVSGWTIAGNYLYTTTLGNTVGIGTINPLSKLNVNGGVGIGTSLTSGAYLNANLAPSGGLIVQNNVGIGTFNPFGGGLIVLPANTGNVGIGSLAPGQALDVTGNIRGTGEIINGNVGIGTSALQTAFAVANGNVGIGTWTAAGGNLIVNGGGNVGIGTAWPGQSLDVTGNIRGTGAIINGNVGIGTSALQTAFAVANGNVGIGTWTAAGGNLIVNGGGNVGIGTAWPGQALDVNGTVRSIGLTMSGSSPFIGYVLTASDSSGDATWTSPGTVSGWTIAGNYLYTTTLGNTVGIGTINPLSKLNVNGGVGIGTSLTSGAYLNANLAPSGGLIVQNNVGIGTFNPFGGGLIVLPANTGNVGIGSLAPGQALDVTGNIRGTGEIINGNVGIGTSALQTAFAVANGNVGIGTWTAAGGSLIVATGNVGIGSLTPGQALDVNGTVRTTGFAFTGGNPFNGYVLTSSDSSGDATWESVAAISGWTTAGINVYETAGGNVGIGTVTEISKLNVNGGVGIGTSLTNSAYLNGNAAPSGGLIVQNNVGIGTFNPFGGGLIVLPANTGNVGIGSLTPGQALDVTGNIRGTGEIINGNVGIGTSALQTAFAVANGNVGIGTWTAAGGSLIVATGNVGIGSLTPGQALDVNGTVRTTGFTMSGANPFSGYVLTSSDSSGDTTWTSAGTVSGWTMSGNYLYTTTIGNTVGIGTINPLSKLNVNGGVGIGTSLTSGAYLNANLAPSGGLIVQNNVGIGTFNPFGGGLIVLPANTGNVGIGSLAPGQALDVTGNIRGTGEIINGNVGIGTSALQTAFAVANGNVGIGTWTAAGGNLIVNGGGNVGIGTAWPGQALDVNGTVRTVNFTMSGANPFGGYVLTASDSSGDVTWTSAGAVSGWTIAGNELYTTTLANNVGIGTFNETSKLNVNGGVGIGTSLTNGAYLSANAAPSGGLIVQNNVGIGTFNPFGGGLIVLPANTGNVGIGSLVPGQALDVTGNIRGTGEIINGNVGIGTSALQTAFAVANGNVGIGTWTAAGGSLIVATGNVGIGSLTPGQALDVNGTVRTTGFAFTGGNPFNGYVLTSSDSSGDATWESVAAISGWTTAGINVYETAGGNVGIGTVTEISKLNVNGGVGIGTSLTNSAYLNGNAAPSGGLIVQNNVGIGTFNPFGGGLIVLPANTGNVGIGSLTPGQALDVTGTVRMTGLTLTGNGANNGYVMVTNTVGVGTWMPANTLFSSGGTNYWTNDMGNVGINTMYNVGIGTIAQVNALNVLGSVGVGTISYSNYLTTAAPSGGAIFEGNVGIGTWAPGSALIVRSGNVGIGTYAATSRGALEIWQSANTVNNGLAVVNTAGSSIRYWADVNNNARIEGSGGGTGTVLINGSGGSTPGNVGIGTLNTPESLFDVNGNASIGFGYYSTAAPTNGLIVQGNVGVGSTAPGQALDVTGTVRTTLFTMTGANPSIGYVLTSSDSTGDVTWTSPGNLGINYWVNDTGNVGINTTYNVGLGTISQINTLNILGNVGIGTVSYSKYLTVPAPNGGAIFEGNVGIGSWEPSLALTIGNGYGFSIGGSVLAGNLHQGGSNGFLNVYGGNVSQGGQIIFNGATAPSNAGVLQFLTGTSSGQEPERMRIDANGNVGVGSWTVNNINNSLAIVGNIGIGTNQSSAFLQTSAPNGGMIVQNNVGIGSLAPGQALDVTGTVRTTGFTMSGTNPLPGYVLTSSDSSGDATWESAGSISGWTTAVNNLYTTINSYNVGIGTVSEISKLNVNGGVGIGTSLTNGAYLNGNSAPSGGLIVQGNVGIGTFNPFGGGLIVLPANTGNVGIGSLTPGQALDVTGTVRMTGLTMTGSNPSIGYVLTSSDSTGDVTWTSAGNLGINYWVNDTGNVGINTTYNVGLGTISQINTLNILGNVGVGTISYSNYLKTPAPSGGAIFEGNVGIGTWLPAALFQIGTGVNTSTGFEVNSSGSIISLSGDNNASLTNTILSLHNTGAIASVENDTSVSGGGLLIEGSSGGATNAVISLKTTSGVGSGDYVDIAGGNNGTTDIARFLGTGSVGIGTVSPLSKLNVNGGVGIGTSLTNGAYLNGNSAPSGGLIVQGNVGIGTFNPFGGGLIVLPANTGNVGIGSLVPGQALDVTGTVRTTGLTMTGSNPSIGYVLTSSDSTGDVTWTSAGNLGINYWVNDTGNVGINTTYNVGLGTISQINTLNILGNVGVGTISYSKYLTTPAPNGGAIFEGNIGIGTWVPAGRFQINSPTTSPFFVSSNGNVGIGTTLVGGVGGIGLAVMNGNVGIGTWIPGASLDMIGISNNNGGIRIEGSSAVTTTGRIWMDTSPNLRIDNGANPTGNIILNGLGTGNVGIGTVVPAAALGIVGNVGIGTGINSPYVSTTPPSGGMIVQGNVGLGSLAPGQALDVQGTIRTLGFTLSGTNPSPGYVLTALDSSGDGTWESASGLSGWNLVGNELYTTTLGNNVGIGTLSEISKLNVNGGVGIGTSLTNGAYLNGNSAPSGGLIVQGNVGIGTFNPFGGGLIVLPANTGNVGIGSLTPGQALDVTGTVRMTGLTLTGNGANNGYVLVTNTVGVGTWMPANTLATAAATNFWLNDTGNVGISTIYAVGIGTTFVGGTGEASFSVMNGNVGIGTWVPNYLLQVGSGTSVFQASSAGNTYVSGTMVVNENNGVEFSNGISATRFAQISSSGGGNLEMQVNNTVNGIYILSNGNVGINSVNPVGELDVEGSLYPTIFYGSGTDQNVGIGSVTPGQALDVQGTVRTTGFTMSGFNPAIGYVLTSSDSSGDATWTPSSGVGTNYWLNDTGNVGISTTYAVGIGTTFVGGTGEAALSVMNGNVGIGTWVPSAPLDIESGDSVSSNNLRINGSGAQGLSITTSSSSGNAQAGINYYGPSLIALTGIAAAPGRIMLSSVPGEFIFDNRSGPIVLSADSSLVRKDIYIATTGNIGIGTFNPFGGKLIISGGNVGIGSLTPGQVLDVNGTIRSISGGFMFPDGTSQTTAASGGNSWTMANGNVYTTNPTNNVGIGTTTPVNGLSVMNGNVGIGTWVPGYALQVNGNIGLGSIANQINLGSSTDYISYNHWQSQTSAGITIQTIGGGPVMLGTSSTTRMTIDQTGNVGIGTGVPAGALDIEGTIFPTVFYGRGANYNVGIGSLTPGQALDVQGTIRTTNFTMSGQTPMSGYVLTASDSAGDTTWSSAGGVGGWTTSGNNVYETNGGNVGIGTTFTTTSALTVMNGNVGIGTWVPNGGLIVASGAGNVGIGSAFPGQVLDVTGTARMTGLTLTGNGAANGYVMVGNSVGIGTWMPATTLPGTGATNYWLNDSGNVGINTTYNIGIGTISQINTMNILGNVGVGTISYSNYLKTPAPNGGAIFEGNVGIGTWLPGSILNVNGSITTMATASAFSGVIVQGTTGINFGNGEFVVENANGNSSWEFAAETNAGAPAPSAPDFVFYDAKNSLDPFRIYSSAPSNSFVLNSSGNLGIDTAFPGSNLSVLGGESIGAYATFTAPAGGIIISGNVGIGTFNPFGGGLIVLPANTGNVGIGSLAPGQALDVTGTVRMTGLTLTGNGAANGYVMVGNSVGIGTWMPASTLPGTGAVNYWVNDTGNVGINTTYNVGIGTISQVNTMNILGNVGVGTISYSKYLTTPAPSGGAIFEGNVGIGTWVPQTAWKLQIVGSMSVGGGSVDAAIFTSGGGNVLSQSSGNLVIGNGGWGGLEFYPGNAETMFINTSGNVGIGTTIPAGALTVMSGNVGIGTWVPGALLDVAGTVSDVQISNSGNIVASGDITALTDIVGSAVLVNNGNGGVATSTLFPLGLGVNFNFNALTISTTNNVGIGTNRPFSKLTVNGGVGIGTSLTNNEYLNGNSAPSGGLIVQGNVGIGTFNPFGGGLIVLPANTGNVGIGSLAPGQALDVTGTVRMTGLTLTGNGANNGYVMVGNSVGIGTWMPASTLPGTGAVNYWVNDTGNVGINTTYNVGIGTISQVNTMNILGNVGVGTISYSNYITSPAPNGGALFEGNIGIGTWLPSSSLSIQGSIAVHVISTSVASYNASAVDQVILANASGNSVTITLPQAATVPFREYIIKKTDNTANAVIIQGHGAENIDGQNSVTTTNQYQSYTIVCDGTQWYII